MKALLYILVGSLASVAGCSPSAPQLTTQQQAITSYLNKKLDDPASYQPVHWGTPIAWQQKDADKLVADSLMIKAKEALSDAEKLMGYSYGPAKKLFNTKMAEAKHFRLQADSLRRSSNTKPLGQVLIHAYRAKNKMGGLVLDSARFVVCTNNRVRQI